MLLLLVECKAYVPKGKTEPAHQGKSAKLGLERCAIGKTAKQMSHLDSSTFLRITDILTGLRAAQGENSLTCQRLAWYRACTTCQSLQEEGTLRS